MNQDVLVTLLLCIILALLVFSVFVSLYSTSIRKNGRKKIVEINLEVRQYVIQNIAPAIKGNTITLAGAGKKLRFLIEDKDNPGYRVGQPISVAMTSDGPRLLSPEAQQSHIMYQSR